MALKAVHVSDVPTLDQVLTITGALSEAAPPAPKPSKFLVIGHRGNGMNSDDYLCSTVKENSILSFNRAARLPLQFIEFDVQVTNDGHAIIFHDNFILTPGSEMRVTELSLQEFLSYGSPEKPLLRRSKDGRIYSWDVDDDDALCTLEEAFMKVESGVGFNIELKFDDDLSYREEELVHSLRVILDVVHKHAGERPLFFSSFHPDAARLAKAMQSTYPVFFLTDGGCEIYSDTRRNSLEEAIKLCLENGLQGIVSEVRGVFRNPAAVQRIKESKLALLTYGRLNNVPEAVCMQRLMGTDGVIVDRVREITEAVSEFSAPATGEEMEGRRLEFSHRKLCFLLKLIPELVRQ